MSQPNQTRRSTLQIESLESKVHELLGLIPSLKNLLQPVNRLPPETLSHIIRYIPEEHARDASSIIPMTHVCRYWRESIISTPENWTTISNQRIDLARLSLERCKAAPLELRLDVRQAGVAPGFSHLIKPYIQNTEVLRVDFGPNEKELTKTLQEFLPSIPNLRFLSLSARGGSALWGGSKDPCSRLTSPLTHLYLSRTPLFPSLLRLGTLTDLTIRNSRFNLHLDTLLDFLEENSSLEYATLHIQFAQPSLRDSRGRTPIKNQLRSLSISSECALDGKALVSKIEVQKGAHLEVRLLERTTGSNNIDSVVSAPHIRNLRSPIVMEYCLNEWCIRTIRLLGPNGSFSLKLLPEIEAQFVELPLLPLNDIRTFHLKNRVSDPDQPTPTTTPFPHFFFPALETLAIERETDASRLLSGLFSNPSFSPSLKTLAFLDCNLGGGFMEELTRFSSNRKNTTSAPLYHVAIVNSAGKLPPFPLIEELRKHVPVVDVRIDKELPAVDGRFGGVLPVIVRYGRELQPDPNEGCLIV